MGIFPDAHWQLSPKSWPNYELVRDIIVVLVTCKNEEDPIKREDAIVLTTLYIGNDVYKLKLFLSNPSEPYCIVCVN